MNQRLQQFLAAENISQAQFADTIEVARASVSHILAGRNKPGFDFIQSLSLHYPKLNLEWLINGKGKMYKQDPAPAEAVMPAPAQHEQKVEQEPTSAFSDELFAPEKPEKTPVSAKPAQNIEQAANSNTLNTTTQSIKNQRTISKIVVFYDDNTYQELK